MAKHPPGREGLIHSPADGGNFPSEVASLQSVVKSWQKGPFCPPGYVRPTEDRLCERIFSVQRPSPVC